MDVVINNVSLPVIKELKDNLANLSLLFLGQHLWSITVGTKSKPLACLCKCCEKARKTYQLATGVWPTTKQEHDAMDMWGTDSL